MSAMSSSDEEMFKQARFLNRLVASSIRISETAGQIIKVFLKLYIPQKLQNVMAGGDLQIVDKSVDGSPDLQTEADRRAQYCIVQSLQKRFSSLKIVGEEVSFVLFLYALVIF